MKEDITFWCLASVGVVFTALVVSVMLCGVVYFLRIFFKIFIGMCHGNKHDNWI